MGSKKNKIIIASFSLSVSVILVIAKVAIAYISNSIGVFSEALNNGLDLVTVLIAFLAIRIAIRPPDKDHTYGHGKYENLSAAAELIIISLLSLFIIYRSIIRLIYRDFDLNFNGYVFIVLVFSVALNIARVFFVGKAAKKYSSFLFEAEFLNYSSDIAISIIVIIGLLLARAGYMLADPIASIITAIIVLIFTLRLSIKVFRNFLDYIPAEVTDKISKVLISVKEIKKVNEIRIHEVGNIKFINLDVSLDENLYLSQVEKIKKSIKENISMKIPNSRIILETKTDFSSNNIISKMKEMVFNHKEVEDMHNTTIHEIKGQIDLFTHIILKKDLCLDETEILTKKIEDEAKIKIPDLRSIYIHIEESRGKESFRDITSSSLDLIEKIKTEISEYVNPDTCHNFTILEKKNIYNIAFHCRLNKKLKVEQAHMVATSVEDTIRKKINNIGDISIHVEPF
ncbi:MAG: cation-efflux pump [Actinomycetia bacterium]|nr:cation-efflux pump [Actinomycetes bacterium]